MNQINNPEHLDKDGPTIIAKKIADFKELRPIIIVDYYAKAILNLTVETDEGFSEFTNQLQEIIASSNATFLVILHSGRAEVARQ